MSEEKVVKHDFSKEKKPNEQSEVQIELEDYTYRLEEMIDSMEASLANLVKVQAQQKALIDIVKNNNEDKMFDEFIKESEKQMQTLEQQRQILTIRKEIFKQVVDAAKANESIARNISMFCKALGMFEA